MYMSVNINLCMYTSPMCYSVRQSIDGPGSAYAAKLSQAAAASSHPKTRTSTGSTGTTSDGSTGRFGSTRSPPRTAPSTGTGTGSGERRGTDTSPFTRRTSESPPSTVKLPRSRVVPTTAKSTLPIGMGERQGIVSRKDLPAPLAQTLDHIVGQVTYPHIHTLSPLVNYYLPLH